MSKSVDQHNDKEEDKCYYWRAKDEKEADLGSLNHSHNLGFAVHAHDNLTRASTPDASISQVAVGAPVEVTDPSAASVVRKALIYIADAEALPLAALNATDEFRGYGLNHLSDYHLLPWWRDHTLTDHLGLVYHLLRLLNHVLLLRHRLHRLDKLLLGHPS